LFELLGQVTEDEGDIRFATLSLLAGIANMHVSDGEERLRGWFDAHPQAGALQLPEPVLDY
ncbi:MAG: hypothetical protein KDC98_02975, partial [Planctomycetes bacterium]|nr:hypothetical protein [Planctomycetota bacterium]